jgi:transcription antitermination factor NusG
MERPPRDAQAAVVSRVRVCAHALRDKLRVQQVPGVARLVGFDGTPAALPEEEIEGLKKSLAGGVRAEPHPFLTVGRRVRIKGGPLVGVEGIVIRRKNGIGLVISLSLIQRQQRWKWKAADLEDVY